MKARRWFQIVAILALAAVGLPSWAADEHAATLWLPNWGGTSDESVKALYDEVRSSFPLIDKIRIVDIDGGALTQKVLMAPSTGDRFEATMVNKTENLITLLDNGILKPIDDLLEKYGQDLKKAIPPEGWASAKYKGKTYFIPWNGVPVKNAWLFRKDVLDEVKMKMPKSVAELERTMEAIKKRYPKDPVLSTWRSSNDIIVSMLGNQLSGLRSQWVVRKDGTLVPWMMTSYGKEIAKKLNDWIKKGYLSPDWAVMTRDLAGELYRRGQAKIAVWWGDGAGELDALAALLSSKDWKTIQMSTGNLAGPKGKLRAAGNPWVWGPGFTTFGDAEAQVTLMQFYNWEAKDFRNNATMLYGPEGLMFDLAVASTNPLRMTAKQLDFTGKAQPQWGWNRHGLWWNEALAAVVITEDPTRPQGWYRGQYGATAIDTSNVWYDPFNMAAIPMRVPDIWEKYPNAKQYWTCFGDDGNANPYWAVAGTVGDFEKAWKDYMAAVTAASLDEVAKAQDAYLSKTFGEEYAAAKARASRE